MTPTPAASQFPDDVVTLAGGGRMPLLGFGTWQITGREAVQATVAALDAGYRHLDTATVYGNEGEVGQALADSGVAREDVFITTKFPPSEAGQELETLNRSLDLLGTDYVDLWLIHWPRDDRAEVDIWRALIQAHDLGLARDIGVSNFGINMIDELSEKTGAAPTVNQIEWSPLLFDPNVLAEHQSRNVALEGYSALRGGTLDHPTIAEIADGIGRTPAQVIIRWHLQHGVVVIPKSRNPERIRSNAEVADFELSADQMTTLDGLGASG